MTQTLTVNLPHELYLQIKKRADDAKRSVEIEAVELLSTTIPATLDLQQIRDSLNVLDNSALQKASQSRLASELSSELESLHLKQQREGLTDAETARCAELVQAYDRSMLIRAQAAALLKKRGIDLPTPIAQP